METERTPVISATFVSALSQQWIFALYEVFRTWRQRVGDLLAWQKDWLTTPETERPEVVIGKHESIRKRAADPQQASAFYWGPYERVTTDSSYAGVLRNSFDRTNAIFKRLEVLRVALAKHEMPDQYRSYALAPGYGRIDMMTGSIYWQVALQGDEADIISRRSIADSFRTLGLPELVETILPPEIQERI